MPLERGDVVWIPCEVTRRVFPDERNVRIDLPDGHWDGVVDVRQLREEVSDGRTAIRFATATRQSALPRRQVAVRIDPTIGLGTAGNVGADVLTRVLRVPFDWPAKAQTARAKGEHELGAVVLDVKP